MQLFNRAGSEFILSLKYCNMNLHIKISPSPWKKVSLPGSTAEFRDMITVLKIRLHIKIKSTPTRGDHPTAQLLTH